MDEPLRTYESLLSTKKLGNLSDVHALEKIGILIDLAADLRKKEGLEHAVRLSEELQQRADLAPGLRVTSHYFLANAWADMRVLTSSDQPLALEQPFLEREVLHLRKALANEKGLCDLPDGRVCQILTNLGNALSTVGRSVEAIEYWDRALMKSARFPMALGNRGYGFSYYAGALYDKGHQRILLKQAHSDLSMALSSQLRERLEGEAHEAFEGTKTSSVLRNGLVAGARAPRRS